jgi:hypothetical protein
VAQSGAVQKKGALVGKPYDEQVAMLSPGGAKGGEANGQPVQPVQMDSKAGAEAAKPADAGQEGAGAEAKTEVAEPPQIQPYAYSAAELQSLVDGVCPDRTDLRWRETAERWVAHGIECNRFYAKDQVRRGNFEGLDSAAAFESDVVAVFGEAGKAAVAKSPPVGEWLTGVLGAFLSGSPVNQKVLAEDKGHAKGADDKSQVITESFIAQLDALEAAVRASYPAEGQMAVKEITVRRELFKMFAQHHDKSNAESGVSSAKSSVRDKKAGVTSCNAYQGQLLRDAFGSANAIGKETGEGGLNVKATTQHGWDMEKKKATVGPKKRAFGFYDVLGRGAKEVGAWTDGAPGLSPKAGDMYVLAEGRSISHIGFFKFAETGKDGVHDIWHTFDGGQPAGTPMSAEGFVGSVRDGALNNIKRAYHKGNNTAVIPAGGTLAKIRGEAEQTAEGAPVQVNQDGKLRRVAGIIDVGKLIELDKQAPDKK